MAINKVEANGETLIDLTSDTVTADTLLSGRTAHLASGVQATGTFEPVTGVKGNAESAYRKGNVNLTPANLGLGNVDNTSDANKPISTAAQAKFDTQQAQIDSIFTLIPQADINHNGIFRGENLTNVWVENGKIKEALYIKVHSGDFSGLYLGDYFTVSITTDIYTKFTGSSFVSGTTYYTLGGEYPNWDYTATTDTEPTGEKMYFTKQTVTENVDLMIAAFDYYYNVGDTALTSHHLVLIPRKYGFKTTAKMNSTNTTVGSYYNCEMHQFTLPCYAKSLKTALNNHLLAHRTILPNEINASTPSMAGAGFTGASNSWAWKTVELQLMSEPQIYGTTIWSSSAYDVGVDYKKFPVFDFINGVQYDRGGYWLRPVVSSTHFARCLTYGYAILGGASDALFVRPQILYG